MGVFERYLTLWVGLCIIAGVSLGNFVPQAFAFIANLEYTHVNLVVALFTTIIRPDSFGRRWIMQPFGRKGFLCRFWLALALGAVAGAANAQSLSGSDLVEALRAGGYYIAMRHASSPRSEPDAASAHPGNVNRERQLDEAGLASAAAMGEALRELEIPVGAILSSPTFRAVETVGQLSLGEAETFPQLDSRGRDTAWLLERVATDPPSGMNTIIVTHAPNLGDAFGEAASGMADGEALILRPDGDSASVVTRIAIEDWPALAER